VVIWDRNNSGLATFLDTDYSRNNHSGTIGLPSRTQIGQGYY
jgi:hypothetical protein